MAITCLGDTRIVVRFPGPGGDHDKQPVAPDVTEDFEYLAIEAYASKSGMTDSDVRLLKVKHKRIGTGELM